jgi:hypothetical protein
VHRLAWGFDNITEGNEEYNTLADALHRALELTECRGTEYAVSVSVALRMQGYFRSEDEWIKLEEF